jgi:hypothetical protein
MCQRSLSGKDDPVAHGPAIFVCGFLDRRVQLVGETQGDPYVALG